MLIESLLLEKLRSEQQRLEREVFLHPPQSHDDFQQRLGRWQGVQHAIETLAELIEERDSK